MKPDPTFRTLFLILLRKSGYWSLLREPRILSVLKTLKSKRRQTCLDGMFISEWNY